MNNDEFAYVKSSDIRLKNMDIVKVTKVPKEDTYLKLTFSKGINIPQYWTNVSIDSDRELVH